MKHQQLHHGPITPTKFLLLVLTVALLLWTSSDAFADSTNGLPVTKSKPAAAKKRKPVKRARPAARFLPYQAPGVPSPATYVETSLALNTPQLPPTPPASTSLVTSAATSEVTKRILNLRIQPTYLVSMLTDKTVVAAGRADLDFVLGDKFALGPSVIYQQTSTLDAQALASSGISQSMNEGVLEVGLLSSIYLTGTTSTGGFILRPHAYWSDPNGQKVDSNGNVTSTAKNTQGARAGSEFIYQVIMASGFNFEVGGGFTYYLVPYSMQYSDGGTPSTGPTSRFLPTASIGVGWAF